MRWAGTAGELAVLGVRSRPPAGAVMPVVMFTGLATGTVYMQAVENSAARGRIQPDYAQDIKTLNYVVVGMVTLFVAVMLVNTLIAATAARRREFAQQRLAGSTRPGPLAMVALEGLLATVTGVLGGTVASLFTILPFTSARIGQIWPDQRPWPYAVVVTTAIALTTAAMLSAARHAAKGPTIAAMRG